MTIETEHAQAARPARHRLFIDESGDHTYKLLDDPSHRYLALLGVWFRQDPHYMAFTADLENFKRDIFVPRPEPLILHRSDIINRRGPFGILRDGKVQARFNTGLLEVIKRANFKIICVIIDKMKHLDQYIRPFHPYHYSLVAMLEPNSGWLNYMNAVGDVMAESRGREEDLQLSQAYNHLYQSGTRWFAREHLQRALTSKDIKIQPKKANIAGLQLADMLAHPIKQACLIEASLINDVGNVFGKRVMEIAERKFNINYRTGLVRGYGKVWL